MFAVYQFLYWYMYHCFVKEYTRKIAKIWFRGTCTLMVVLFVREYIYKFWLDLVS